MNQKPFSVEFIAPLPVERCVALLKTRHEDFSFLSFRWQTRLVVQVNQTDPFTYGFMVKRVGKSTMVAWGGVARVEGFLRAQSSKATVVLGQPYFNWYFILFSQIVFALATAALFWNWHEEGLITDKNPLMAVGGWLLLNIGLFLLTVIWAWWQAQNMLAIVRGTLGQIPAGES